MLEIETLFLIGSAYLLLLFGLAYSADRGWIPDSFIRHPTVYVLSLGVFVSAWGFYGAIGIAHDYGYDFLAYYFGICSFFLFGSLILFPLQRLCRDYQLTSLADLFTFRFRSQWAGVLVTLFLSLSMLPLMASQIKIFTDTTRILTGAAGDEIHGLNSALNLGLIFCVAIGLFTMLFGSRRISYRQRHNGLVAAIAFATLVKTIVLAAIGGASVYGIFGGFHELNAWLESQGELLRNFEAPPGQEGRSLLLLSFAAAMGMPHMFHMIFSEKPTRRALRTAVWALPALLLVLALPVLPILWGAMATGAQIPREYFALAIGLSLDSPLIGAITYIGGLSAASGAMIVSTLAMASMYLNHMILPFYQPGADRDIYSWLLWIRRLLIAAILLGGYLFYRALAAGGNLFELGLSAFTAVLQFLPGIIALLFIPTINRSGFIAGLLCGMGTWFATLFLPVMTQHPLPLAITGGVALHPGEGWSYAVVLSFSANIVVMTLVSALTSTSDEEKASAALCSLGGVSHPHQQGLRLRSVAAIQRALAAALGHDTAAQEVEQALQDLGIEQDEARPLALRRLCQQLEVNLSGLLGTTLAQDIIQRRLLRDDAGGPPGGDDIQLIETRLEGLQMHFTGLAAELNNLRHFHRQTLLNLPIGACIINDNGEVVLWNRAMEAISGIASTVTAGNFTDKLPSPWHRVLPEFAAQSDHQKKLQVSIHGESRWLTLHQARSLQQAGRSGDTIVLVEDITDTRRLEDKLIHSERLASIGRLAAGVAHEIGNPLTGIASLSQHLRSDSDSAQIREIANDIVTQSDRIAEILRTLINFSHIGQTRLQTNERPVAVQHCVTEAIKLLQLSPEATPVQFRNECPGEDYILGDQQRLTQILLNLLGNARDASESGGIITVTSQALGSDSLEIRITDEGCGIEPAQLERIFEPFYTSKSPGRGTGLGLALVYSMIEDLQGSIHAVSPVDTERGRGTCFCVQLPRPELAAALSATQLANP